MSDLRFFSVIGKESKENEGRRGQMVVVRVEEEADVPFSLQGRLLAKNRS
jgi:hypothetical protein